MREGATGNAEGLRPWAWKPYLSLGRRKPTEPSTAGPPGSPKPRPTCGGRASDALNAGPDRSPTEWRSARSGESPRAALMPGTAEGRSACPNPRTGTCCRCGLPTGKGYKDLPLGRRNLVTGAKSRRKVEVTFLSVRFASHGSGRARLCPKWSFGQGAADVCRMLWSGRTGTLPTFHSFTAGANTGNAVLATSARRAGSGPMQSQRSLQHSAEEDVQLADHASGIH